MATHAVLLAVTGARYEAELLAEIDRVPGRITVARRCLDLADLLAAAAAGLGPRTEELHGVGPQVSAEHADSIKAKQFCGQVEAVTGCAS